ncbi:MAG: GvpL/GvpF family gas vesicle protein [Gemmatimonadaceae bacterium]|nr:GvpL/GvpF family gas vesicle protein [Gemmatimonadaceae bacterium]
MSEHVVYVYGIVPAAIDTTGAPRGLDDAPVCAERAGDVAALTSRLDAPTYAGGTAEARAGDVAWIGPRAIAHDAVLTWASDAGAVIPLPMFTLFADLSGVQAMLAAKRERFRAILDRVAPAQEYTLRVFRLDAAVAATLGALSPRVSALEQQAAAATPGQRYLLERKLDGERRTELRRVSDEVANAVYTTIAGAALAAVRDPLPTNTPDDGVGRSVLNASFLVSRTGPDAFRAAVTALAQQYEPRGFRFELTGPWPPYHFVRERDA